MEQIELSRPDIRAVIHSGRAEQSPLAASFIKKVMNQFDIEIVACYAESYVSVHTTQDQRIKFYGIFEGEKQFDDLR